MGNVSYTHLDVYKRQVDCGRLHLWLAERWMRLRPLRRYPLAILRRICRK